MGWSTNLRGVVADAAEAEAIGRLAARSGSVAPKGPCCSPR